jgi:hypothetical protein
MANIKLQGNTKIQGRALLSISGSGVGNDPLLSPPPFPGSPGDWGYFANGGAVWRGSSPAGGYWYRTPSGSIEWRTVWPPF